MDCTLAAIKVCPAWWRGWLASFLSCRGDSFLVLLLPSASAVEDVASSAVDVLLFLNRDKAVSVALLVVGIAKDENWCIAVGRCRHVLVPIGWEVMWKEDTTPSNSVM